MTIALVDDETEYLHKMETLICDFAAETGRSIETASFESGSEFLGTFKESGYDAVFMDIYMDGMDGIAAAAEMRVSDRFCPLVFLTTSSEHMPDAFACHAFEYVTKPFTRERIFKVLSDIIELLPDERKYVEVISLRRAVPVFLDEIVCVVTDAHYIDISLTNGSTVRTRMTMAAFASLLGNDGRFLTINKGILANADRILEFEGGCCVMDNGTRLPVRVRDRRSIEQAARDYTFRRIRERQMQFAAQSAPHS